MENIVDIFASVESRTRWEFILWSQSDGSNRTTYIVYFHSQWIILSYVSCGDHNYQYHFIYLCIHVCSWIRYTRTILVYWRESACFTITITNENTRDGNHNNIDDIIAPTTPEHMNREFSPLWNPTLLLLLLLLLTRRWLWLCLCLNEQNAKIEILLLFLNQYWLIVRIGKWH